MSDAPILELSSLPLAAADLIDRACDRFEAEWRASRRPTIESFLDEATGLERAALLRELLAQELELRRADGERPARREYHQRFPADAESVVAAFDAVPTESLGTPVTQPLPSLRPWPSGVEVDRTAKDVSSVAEYEILDLLGRGGMGVVYRARHRLLNRIVALKMIRDGTGDHPEQLARFLIEAEAVARLHHPNILQIYEIGAQDGLPFVTLEMLEGGSLTDRLGGTPQPGRAAAALVATLASAMDAAHQAGIVHRDLKPSNVLFNRDGVPKITDFGVAKRLEIEQGNTLSGQVVGTPSYMAPEQALGLIHQVGPPADIYALGAILYEMLTGRPPFKGPTTLETLRQVVFEEAVPPSRLQSQVARDLETICQKCLQKEPQKRYSTAQALADDLRRYLAGLPIQARRTPLWERGVKWARRRRVTATLLALGLAALVALTGVAIQSNTRRRQHDWDEAFRLAKLRAESDRTLFKGQSHVAQRQWDEARFVLNGLLNQIRNEPQLISLHTRAADLLRQADRGRAERNAAANDRRRYERFFQLRKETLFQETQFTGLDIPGSEEVTRRSARDALALFAAPDSSDTWTLSALPATFSERERAEITEGCYELLLILAEATDPPDQGLRFLDQAARLHPEPTRAYYQRQAVCLARKGDSEGSGRARTAAEQIQPSSALDHFLTGTELYKRGDWSKAHQHFEAALRLQPDHFWAHCLTAVCCLQMNQPREAVPELNACLLREPDFAWLYVLRGYTLSLIAARHRDEAELFQAAAADFQRAWTLLEDRPGDELRYVLLVDRGLMWLQWRELDKAAADLRQAITLNGQDFQAFAALARIEHEWGHPDEAITCYTRAIQSLPDWAPLYRGRADVYLGLKDLTPAQRALALSDLDRAIALVAPGDPVVARDHTNRGRLLHDEGRDPEALDACAAALTIAPDYAAAQFLRLQLLLDLKRDDEVLSACEVVLARGRPSAELYELRALARARRGDYTGAIEDDTKALGLRPDRTPLLARRGWLYLTVKAPTLALSDFERALECDPSNGDAYEGRGAARIGLGDYRAAVTDAEAALRLGKPSARLAYNAARIYAQAARAITSEVRRKGRDAVFLANKYQDRAATLATEAMRQTPPENRAAFWRQQIQTDPAMQSIVPRLRFAGLSPSQGSN
jgi:serine/threonine protein kinase/predicted Zn-dependent protease